MAAEYPHRGGVAAGCLCEQLALPGRHAACGGWEGPSLLGAGSGPADAVLLWPGCGLLNPGWVNVEAGGAPTPSPRVGLRAEGARGRRKGEIERGARRPWLLPGRLKAEEARARRPRLLSGRDEHLQAGSAPRPMHAPANAASLCHPTRFPGSRRFILRGRCLARADRHCDAQISRLLARLLARAQIFSGSEPSRAPHLSSRFALRRPRIGITPPDARPHLTRARARPDQN